MTLITGLKGAKAQSNSPIGLRIARCAGIALLCLALILPIAAPSEEENEQILTQGLYEYILSPEGDAEIIRCKDDGKHITIPESLNGHNVTAVRDYAFSEAWGLVSVTIPAGVTDLGANPFAGCLALTQITVPEGHPTLRVAEGALYDRRTDTLIAYPAAAAIGEVSIAAGTKAIGDSAFATCRDLVKVALPEGIRFIGANAFSECIALTDISLPSSLTGIGDGAFSICSSLKNITLPYGLVFLGQDAFSLCASLLSVTLPDSLTDLTHNPFTGCKALSKVVLSPDHPALQMLDGVLYNHPSACLICYPAGRDGTAFTIPEWVRQIGPCAFASSRLTHITLPEGMTVIGDHALAQCPFLTNVDLPGRLNRIGDSAFSHCFRLSGISFPASLTEIGDRAFSYCSALTALALPESLTRIGEEAFCWCSRLNAVTLPASLALIGEDAFLHCEESLVFTVPRGSHAEDYCLARGYTCAYADASSDPGDTVGYRPLEHPDLKGRVIGRDRMNLYVYWVQVRLKATGQWYQGEAWDCTGNLGSHTMSEIASFMRSATGADHDGTVDQAVIDALLAVPDAPDVPVGGFYDRLNTLTGGDRFGDMVRVDRTSPREAVIWVQTCLKHLGYYSSAIDGDFGSGTLRALHAFQKKYGWVERDHVSYGVARDLLEHYVSAGGDPYALP